MKEPPVRTPLHAAVHRCLPPPSIPTAARTPARGACVSVAKHDPVAAGTAGPCWHRAEQQTPSTQYFGFIMQQTLECAIQVAKADELNGSYLAQGTSLSYVSGTIRPFV